MAGHQHRFHDAAILQAVKFKEYGGNTGKPMTQRLHDGNFSPFSINLQHIKTRHTNAWRGFVSKLTRMLKIDMHDIIRDSRMR